MTENEIRILSTPEEIEGEIRAQAELNRNVKVPALPGHEINSYGRYSADQYGRLPDQREDRLPILGQQSSVVETR